jgi:prolyl-tRNA synthetase
MIKDWFASNLAPIQVVMPIHKTDEQLDEITAEVTVLIAELKKLNVSVSMIIEPMPGFKFAEWELKGSSVRIAVGPKDLETEL